MGYASALFSSVETSHEISNLMGNYFQEQLILSLVRIMSLYENLYIDLTTSGYDGVYISRSNVEMTSDISHDLNSKLNFVKS